MQRLHYATLTLNFCKRKRLLDFHTVFESRWKTLPTKIFCIYLIWVPRQILTQLNHLKGFFFPKTHKSSLGSRPLTKCCLPAEVGENYQNLALVALHQWKDQLPWNYDFQQAWFDHNWNLVELTFDWSDCMKKLSVALYNLYKHTHNYTASMYKNL